MLDQTFGSLCNVLLIIFLVRVVIVDTRKATCWKTQRGRRSRSRTRPLPVTVAAILLVLISLTNLLGPWLPGADEIPAVVLYAGVVQGIVGLVATVGLWMLKTTWGLWLTIVISVINLLSAAPGIAIAPDPALQVFAALAVLVPALTIVLILLPHSRHAFSASSS